MLVISREASWIERLKGLAARRGWPFEARESLPGRGEKAPPARALVVLDRALAGGSPARAVAALRALYPSAAVALACADGELGPEAVAAALTSGAEETLVKSWPDEKLSARLTHTREAALAAEVRVTVDGALKVERRSRRALALARGRWEALPLSAPGLELLWRLLEREGEPVSRGDLLHALESALGREVEAETVARQMLALRRALTPWKGALQSVRGGFYRLVSSRRRSTT